MVLDHPVEVDQIAVDVVEDFDFGFGLEKEQRGGTAEGFDVALVVREQRQDLVGQLPLAADPGDDRFGHCEPLVVVEC